MTVVEIVLKYMKKHGYTGLCNSECGCSADNLMPCGEMQSDCQVGYSVDCDGCEEYDDCEYCPEDPEYNSVIMPTNCRVEKKG